jgi:hypothetical protein
MTGDALLKLGLWTTVHTSTALTPIYNHLLLTGISFEADYIGILYTAKESFDLGNLVSERGNQKVSYI